MFKPESCTHKFKDGKVPRGHINPRKKCYVPDYFWKKAVNSRYLHYLTSGHLNQQLQTNLVENFDCEMLERYMKFIRDQIERKSTRKDTLKYDAKLCKDVLQTCIVSEKIE